MDYNNSSYEVNMYYLILVQRYNNKISLMFSDIFGLRTEVFNALMSRFNHPSIILDMIYKYGIDTVNKGYYIVCEETGLLEVQRVDELGLFDSDEDAVTKAIEDGVSIIPIDELPKNFDRKYLGWVDTQENRELIKNYCRG